MRAENGAMESCKMATLAEIHKVLVEIRDLIHAIHIIHSSTIKENINNSPISEGREESAERRGGRAQRLPENFDLNEDMTDWAACNIGRDMPWLIRETENFVDYWRAASGQSARKRDWVAAWRNWIRKADDVQGSRDRQKAYTKAQRS